MSIKKIRLSVVLISLLYFSLYAVNRPASSNPPGGLSANQVPQFVVIGFDDNAYSGDSLGADSKTVFEGNEGMRWIQSFMKDLKNPTTASPNPANFDGTPARMTFYMTSYYMSGYNGDNPALVRNATRILYNDGHEIGNHTQSHNLSWNNTPPDVSGWSGEMATCNEWLTKPLAPDTLAYWQQAESKDYGVGINASVIVGFRTPFLICDDETFVAMQQNGFTYDCSIEEGYQEDQDGSNFYWPYTLDDGGTDGWAKLIEMSGPDYDPENTIPNKEPLSSQPGFWEVPNHCVIVPPDNECANYGINYSLRGAIQSKMSWFDTQNGKFTGFDWNFWAQAKMNKEESIAVLKYTLDLRLRSNRAPFMWGAHTGNFTKHKDASYPGITNRERQEVVEEFIEYALSIPEVRIVPAKDIVAWCENPVALGDASTNITNNYNSNKSISIQKVTQFGGNLKVQNNGIYKISLVSSNGQIMKSVSTKMKAGENSFSFNNSSSLASGLYLLDIVGKSTRRISKIAIY